MPYMKTKPMHVTVPEDLIEKVRVLAKKKDRSLSKMVSIILADGVKRAEREK